MTYIKGRVQRYSRSEKKWLLINVTHGTIVGKKVEKYPYVRVLRVHRRGR